MDDQSSLKKARSSALRYLTYRARTMKEVKDYLQKKDHSTDIIDRVVSEMVNYGYVDDERYIQDFINYRKQRGFGRNRIRYELILKGLDKEVIEERIADCFNSEEDLSIIRSTLERRLPSDGHVDQKWLSRQVGFLKRRGYQDSQIIEALRDYKLSD